MAKGPQASFLTIRGIALLGLLVWMLISLTSYSNTKLLMLFAFVVLFWFCFSLLIDLIWPASDHSAEFRHSVFAMIDVYIAVSFLIILQDKVLIAGVVVAVYCLVITVFHGIPVGIVSAMAGVLGVFNSGGLDAGFMPLIFTFAGGLAGSGLGFMSVFVHGRILERANSKKSVSEGAAPDATNTPAPVVETREELLEKIRVMQENFDKVCKERDQLQEQIADLEDKLQKEE